MKEHLAVFFGVVALLCTVGSFGFFIDDEAQLSVGAYNLYRGSLTADVVPEEYYATSTSVLQPRLISNGEAEYVPETRAGAVIAYPIFLALTSWSQIIPLQAMVVVAAACAWLALALTLRSDAWAVLTPQRRHVEQVVLGSGVLLMFTWNVANVREFDAHIWAPPLAMQLTNILLSALGVTAFHQAVARLSRSVLQARAATALLVLGTTFAFWGFGLKYHAPQLALLCGVLYLRAAGPHRTGFHAVAYALAGLAVWMQMKSGGILLLALLGADVVLFLRRPRLDRHRVKQATVACMALGLGLAPYAVETYSIHESVIPTFGAPAPSAATAPSTPGPEPSSDVGSPQPAADSSSPASADPVPPGTPALPTIRPQLEIEATRAQQLWSAFREIIEAVWDGPAEAAQSQYAIWLYPALVTSTNDVQFGMLMLSPLLVLAPLGLWSRRKELSAADAFLIAHFGLTVAVYGSHAATPGSGAYDSRYLFALLPGLSYYAGVFIAPRFAPRARLGIVAMVSATVLLLVLAVLALSTSVGYTAQFHLLRGLGAATAVVVASWGLLQLLVPRKGIIHAWSGVPVVALGFLPPLLFLLQYVVHHAPRSIWSDPLGGGVAHFLPMTAALSAILDVWLGA